VNSTSLVAPSPASLLDYLPQQALVFLDNLEDIRTPSRDSGQAIGLRADYVQDGTLLRDFPYLT
jgi:hypothetical protein